MKTPLLSLLALAAATFAPITARAEIEISFNFFHDSLTPLGSWVEVEDYGPCWQPGEVDDDWAPYTDGYWSYTDCGWTWVSYEDWGSLTYHYGRWVRLDGHGWCWVPGYEWAPAWVSWRSCDDYIGWAPLPPRARWNRSVGFSVWVDRDCDIGPVNYNFCRTVDFGAPVLRGVLCPRRENVTIIKNTVNVTNITYYNTTIFNGGPNYSAVVQQTRRPIPALKIKPVESAPNIITEGGRSRPRLPLAEQRGNVLTVFNPRVAKQPGYDASSAKVRSTKVLPRNAEDTGWRGVNETQRMLLKNKLDEETRGVTAKTLSARPVTERDLRPLPAKADENAVVPGGVPVRRGVVVKDAPVSRPSREEETKREIAVRPDASDDHERPAIKPRGPMVKLPEPVRGEPERTTGKRTTKELPVTRSDDSREREQAARERAAEQAERSRAVAVRERAEKESAQRSAAQREERERAAEIARQRFEQERSREESNRRNEAVQRQREDATRQRAVEQARERAADAQRQRAVMESRQREAAAAQQRAAQDQQRRAVEAQRRTVEMPRPVPSRGEPSSADPRGSVKKQKLSDEEKRAMGIR